MEQRTEVRGDGEALKVSPTTCACGRTNPHICLELTLTEDPRAWYCDPEHGIEQEISSAILSADVTLSRGSGQLRAVVGLRRKERQSEGLSHGE